MGGSQDNAIPINPTRQGHIRRSWWSRQVRRRPRRYLTRPALGTWQTSMPLADQDACSPAADRRPSSAGGRGRGQAYGQCCERWRSRPHPLPNDRPCNRGRVSLFTPRGNSCAGFWAEFFRRWLPTLYPGAAARHLLDPFPTWALRIKKSPQR